MNSYLFSYRGVFRIGAAGLCLLGLLVLGTFTAASTAAIQVSLPTPTLAATFTPTLQPTQADWLVNQGLVVSNRAGAWLRQTPDSESQRIISVLANGAAVTMNGPAYFDGVQWWWLVTTATGQSGWVEQAALNLTASRDWNPGQRLSINKPEVWLRAAPSSVSETIVDVLRFKSVVTVSGEPVFDGVQWWWPVTTPTEQSGWVEQEAVTEYVPPTVAPPRPRDPVVPPVNDPIPTIEQPPDQPPQPPPGQPPPQQPPTRRPPVNPTKEPTVEQPPDIPATQVPPDKVTTEPPPEFPPTVVANDPVVIAIVPSATATPAAPGGS